MYIGIRKRIQFLKIFSILCLQSIFNTSSNFSGISFVIFSQPFYIDLANYRALYESTLVSTTI